MDKICRLCLNETTNLRDAFADGLVDRIHVICSVKIDKGDRLPLKVCENCVGVVTSAYELRKLSKLNEQLLLKRASDELTDEQVAFDQISSHGSIDNTLCFANEVAFSCDSCGHREPSKKSMELHIRCHLSKKDRSRQTACCECSINFKTRRELQQHKLIHKYFERVDNDGYRCVLCSAIFEHSDRSLLQHISQHRKHTSEGSHSLVCPHCGQIYRTKQILNQHIRRHFDVENYHCKRCPKKFKTWSELFYHSAVHTTERNFICDLCSKAFKAKRDLRNHRIRHETKDVKKFQCNYCQLLLKSKYTLNRHILIHTGEKRFSCDFCQKSFTQNNELNKHLRLHIGENTYRCTSQGCTSAFRLLAELRVHQSWHYETSTNASS